MTYDFDRMTERRGTNSLKWEVGEKELPMWVADMDFETAPAIREAIENRAANGIFGYETVPGEWYRSIQSWWADRYGFVIKKEWLVFAGGVIPAVSSAVRKFTTVGEKVLVQTPAYPVFFHSIRNNGRHVAENRLHYDGSEYRVDFTDLEKKLSDPQTTMMILCNPHNPAGKRWDLQTLERIGALCAKYHVLVLADEIHCDLTDPGYVYVPFASVSKECAANSITCISPSKSFNLAGLQSAAVIVPDENLRHKMERALNTDEAAEPNSFAVCAAIAAYTKGAEWLDALRVYLYENKKFAVEFLEKEVPGITAVPSEATYLLWLDCKGTVGSATQLCRYTRQNTGLYLSDGAAYGGNGERFLRMNLACPRERLADGLRRLKEAVPGFEKWEVSLC